MDLFLTNGQAIALAEDLLEYAKMSDNHGRTIFKGFHIVGGDSLQADICRSASLELYPIPEYTVIPSDNDNPDVGK